MFAFKKLVGSVTMPMTLAVFFALVALVFWLAGRRRFAVRLSAFAVAFAYLASTPFVADALLRPLESAYAPARIEDIPASVSDVAVLGYNYTPHDELPITAAIGGDGLPRIVEGIRLAHRLGAARLVMSGGAPGDAVPSAFGYSLLAEELQVSASIVVLDRALDTASEAREIYALLGDTPFVLVTSAYHMPRAMRLMNRVGARPIPAPTGHKVFPSQSRNVHHFIPSAGGLRNTEVALHEHLGLIAIWLGLD